MSDQWTWTTPPPREGETRYWVAGRCSDCPPDRRCTVKVDARPEGPVAECDRGHPVEVRLVSEGRDDG